MHSFQLNKEIKERRNSSSRRKERSSVTRKEEIIQLVAQKSMVQFKRV